MADFEQPRSPAAQAPAPSGPGLKINFEKKIEQTAVGSVGMTSNTVRGAAEGTAKAAMPAAIKALLGALRFP